MRIAYACCFGSYPFSSSSTLVRRVFLGLGLSLASAFAVGGGSRLARLENDLDMCGDCGCLGLGGCELRRGLCGAGSGVGSNVSLRGDMVGSPNSKAKDEGDRGGSSTTGDDSDVVILGGRGLRVDASVVGELDSAELTGESITGETGC